MIATTIERDRDEACRTLPCPICNADVGDRCKYQERGGALVVGMAHTARYQLAVEAGLVPPLRGVPWTT